MSRPSEWNIPAPLEYPLARQRTGHHGRGEGVDDPWDGCGFLFQRSSSSRVDVRLLHQNAVERDDPAAHAVNPNAKADAFKLF